MIATENKIDLVEEFFYSNERKQIDKEIYNIIVSRTSNKELLSNILYHLRIDKNFQKPTLEHSKRLRSYLCLLFGQENGFSIDELLPLAVSVELLHNSTLIVDDIQDNSEYRCGQLALWKKTGIAKSMNVAFYLANLSQAIFHEYRSKNGYFDYSHKITETINDLFNGQQMDINNSIEKDFEKYKELSFGKTGSLLLLSSLYGVMPYNFNDEKYLYLKDYFEYFSIFYQIRDDLMDIKSNKKIDNGNVINFSMNQNIDFVKDIYNQYKRILIEKTQSLVDKNILSSSKLKSIITNL